MTVFVSLTQGLNKEVKNNINKRSNIIAFIIVTVFVLLGKFIFELFNISIPAFKITGGILIFFIGFEMLQSKPSTVKRIKNVDIDEDIAVSPLAIPILAGPRNYCYSHEFCGQSGNHRNHVGNWNIRIYEYFIILHF